MLYITKPCIVCGKQSQMEVPDQDYNEWIAGKLASDAFPYMTSDDRELLITGTHPDCWDSMFAGMDNGEED